LTPAIQVTTPPSADKLAFPDPHRIRTRDIFRLYARVWPFVRPYRRHLLFLGFAIAPALPAGLLALVMTRIFFDVVGNGHPLTRAEAMLIHAPMNASRETVLLHAIVTGVVIAAIVMPISGVIVGYAIWIL